MANIESRRITEVRSPLLLVEGQNFYAQSPFAKPIAVNARENGLPRSALRACITKIAESEPHQLNSERRREVDKIGEAKLMDIKKMVSKVGRTYLLREPDIQEQYEDTPTSELKEATKNALVHVLGDLESYPLWRDYIKFKRRGIGYGPDGQYTQHAKKFIPEPTYTNWLVKRQATEKRARTWGINEIFPDSDPIEVVKQEDKKAGVRKWVIFNASEL